MRRRHEEGYVLAWATLIMLIMVMGGYAVMRVSYLEGVLASNDVNQAKALNLAEAGLDRALVELGFNSVWNAGFVNQPLDTGTFSVTVAPLVAPGQVQLTSTGKVGGYSKVLTMNVKVQVATWPDVFKYGIYWGNSSNDGVTVSISNLANLHSDFYARGNVNVGNNASVTGNLYSTGTVNGGGHYTRAPLPDPLPVPATMDTTVYTGVLAQAALSPAGNLSVSSKSLAGGTLYVNGDFTLNGGGTITGPGTIVATGNISITNNSNVLAGVSLVSGSNLVIANNVNYEGDGVILYGVNTISMGNNAASANLFLLSPGTVTLANNGANLRGVIWAGSVSISNGVNITGAIYTQQFTGNAIGKCIFTADPTVLNPPPPPVFGGGVQVQSWAEGRGSNQ